MKSPKLIGNLTPDAAVGFADARALQNTGAPYLTKSGPGYTTRLKNGFVEVQTHETKTETAKPYLWFLQHPVGEDNSPTQGVVAEPGKTKRVKLIESDAFTPSTYGTLQGLYVGAGRIALIKAVDEDGVFPGYNAQADTWAVLASARSAAEAALGTAGKAWTYAPAQAVARSLFATGWDAARQTWRWGWSTKPLALFGSAPGNILPPVGGLGSAYLTRVGTWASNPIAHMADTDGSAQTDEVLSSEASTRVHEGGHVFCAGPGRLFSLVAVHDYDAGAGFAANRVEPFVMESADHGDTWSRTTASFLAPLIGLTYAEGPYTYSLLKGLMRDSFAVYIGSGKTLLFMVGAYEAGTEKNPCFLYEGSTFTRLAWGFDTSTRVPYRAFTPNMHFLSPVGFGDQIAVADKSTNLPVSYCFGPGCCAVFTSGGGTFLRVTYDYGATWAELSTAGFPNTLSFITIKPYRSPEAPGKILMRGSAGYYQTDGTFASFRLLGAVGPAGTDGGAVFVNLRKSLYPELPDEFGPP